MSEENKSFTVKDRRQFTAEGERRDGAAVQEAPARTAPPPADHEGSASAKGQPRAMTPPSAEPETAPHGPDTAPLYPSDLSSLLLSLGSQASLLLLGERETGGVDLVGARALITLLEVLKDKTDGRRTEQEDGLLEGLLYELRMAYVARGRAAGP